MSKASDFAARTPIFFQAENFRALVMSDGSLWMERADPKFPISGLGLPQASALPFAQWLLDTFGETP